jgi:hypothetical protein
VRTPSVHSAVQADFQRLLHGQHIRTDGRAGASDPAYGDDGQGPVDLRMDSVRNHHGAALAISTAANSFVSACLHLVNPARACRHSGMLSQCELALA